MDRIKYFWRRLVSAFRMQHDSEIDPNEDPEVYKLASSLVRFQSPSEQQAAIDDVIRYVRDGPITNPVDHSKSDSLEWSDNPGSHEQHLLRRYRNPYFAQSRQLVSNEEVRLARQRDEEEAEIARQRLLRILEEFKALPSIASTGDAMVIREKLEDLRQFSMSIGGVAKDIASKADDIRHLLILGLRKSLSDDEKSLEAVGLADDYHNDHTRKFSVPFVAQMMREDSPIPNDELVSSMLSEDAMTISIVLDLLSENERDELRIAALQLMQKSLAEGYRDPHIDEKLKALSE